MIKNKKIIVPNEEFSNKRKNKAVVTNILNELYNTKEVNKDHLDATVKFINSTDDALKKLSIDNLRVIKKKNKVHFILKNCKCAWWMWLLPILLLLLVGLGIWIFGGVSSDTEVNDATDTEERVERPDRDPTPPRQVEVVTVPPVTRPPGANNNNENNVVVPPAPESRVVVATFEANGATIAINSDSCVIRGSGGSCRITIPEITRDGWTVIGWSTDPNATTSMFTPGEVRFLSMDTRLYAITSKQLTATFNENGADSITDVTRTCTKWNQQTSCNVVTPSIVRNDWTVHGWSTSATHNDPVGVVLEETTVAINNDTTYYAVTSIDHTATFVANGATLVGITNPTCTRWNNDTDCEVTSPVIERIGGIVHGWNEDPLATTATMPTTGASVTVTLSADQTYYAITNIEHIATFNINGADAIGATSLTCMRWNNDFDCTVNAPSITRIGGNPVGWHENANHNSPVGVWIQWMPISLTADQDFYAISSIIHTATFVGVGDMTLTGTNPPMCMRWNTQVSCTVASPTMFRPGWDIFGWDTDANAAIAAIPTTGASVTVTLTQNETFFAIVDQNPTPAPGLSVPISSYANDIVIMEPIIEVDYYVEISVVEETPQVEVIQEMTPKPEVVEETTESVEPVTAIVSEAKEEDNPTDY